MILPFFSANDLGSSVAQWLRAVDYEVPGSILVEFKKNVTIISVRAPLCGAGAVDYKDLTSVLIRVTPTCLYNPPLVLPLFILLQDNYGWLLGQIGIKINNFLVKIK